MKRLSREIMDECEFHEMISAIQHSEFRTMPLVFLNGVCKGVDEAKVKTIKTDFDLSAKDNEIKFMLVPSTFYFSYNYSKNDDGEENSEIMPEEEFITQYVNRLNVISKLPTEILRKIKDKRLLALGYVDPKIRKELLFFLKLRQAFTFMAVDMSNKESIEALAGLTIEKQFAAQGFSSIDKLLHNVRIVKTIKKGKDLYIELSNKKAFTLVRYKILEEEINPDNKYICLFEVHKDEKDYELHFLLLNKGTDFINRYNKVTYSFKDMKFSKLL